MKAILPTISINRPIVTISLLKIRNGIIMQIAIKTMPIEILFTFFMFFIFPKKSNIECTKRYYITNDTQPHVYQWIKRYVYNFQKCTLLFYVHYKLMVIMYIFTDLKYINY